MSAVLKVAWKRRSSEIASTFASLNARGTHSVSGTTVAILSGTCILEATQIGNATYEAAVSVSQSFRVMPITQTITFAAPASVAYRTTPIKLSATATSSLAVTFAVLAGLGGDRGRNARQPDLHAGSWHLYFGAIGDPRRRRT